MKRLLSALVLFMPLISCGTATSRSAMKTIIGTDDRPYQSYSLAAAPRNATGRLMLTSKNGSEVACTGTLVRADVVLTAAHCLVFSGDSFDFGFFYPAYDNGNFAAEYKVKSFVLGTTAPSTIAGRKSDWALVKVEHLWGEQPAPLKMAGLAGSALSYPVTVDLEGYSDDRGNGEIPSFHFGCRLLKTITTASVSNAPLGTIAHDCDAAPGSSGAPLVQRLWNGYQIVAVNTAGNNDLFEGLTGAINIAADTRDAARALTTLR